MAAPLKQMLQNTVDMIHTMGFDRAYGTVAVRPRGTVGRDVKYWEVTWTPNKGSLSHPIEVVLKFDGQRTLAGVATAASAILRKMVQ